MNVFDFRDRLVADYAAYVTSFISIRDPRIRERVDQDLEGLLWPEPSIGLNPSFAKGGWIDDSVAEGVLHSVQSKSFASRGTKATRARAYGFIVISWMQYTRHVPAGITS